MAFGGSNVGPIRVALRNRTPGYTICVWGHSGIAPMSPILDDTKQISAIDLILRVTEPAHEPVALQIYE